MAYAANVLAAPAKPLLFAGIARRQFARHCRLGSIRNLCV